MQENLPVTEGLTSSHQPPSHESWEACYSSSHWTRTSSYCPTAGRNSRAFHNAPRETSHEPHPAKAAHHDATASPAACATRALQPAPWRYPCPSCRDVHGPAAPPPGQSGHLPHLDEETQQLNNCPHPGWFQFRRSRTASASARTCSPSSWVPGPAGGVTPSSHHASPAALCAAPAAASAHQPPAAAPSAGGGHPSHGVQPGAAASNDLCPSAHNPSARTHHCPDAPLHEPPSSGTSPSSARRPTCKCKCTPSPSL